MAYKIITPLAQSFFVEEACVITSIDLFFATKDQRNPVNIHLRENKNGAPGNYMLPFSEVLLKSSQVYTSTNGKIPTYIEFDAPIYVKPGEYSVCIGSGSDEYSIHISEINEIDVNTGRKILVQPSLGSLYKSSNNLTWTPVQEADLKFAIYRAVFDTSVVGNIDFTINKTGLTTEQLTKDPLEVFNGSNLMRVHHFNHGMTNGSYVKLLGIQEAYDAMTQTAKTLYGVSFNSIIYSNLEISNVTSNSYTVELSGNANADARFGGSSVIAERNIIVDALYPVIGKIEESSTRITPKIKATSIDYVVDSNYQVLEKSTNELSSRRIVASPANQALLLASADTLEYRLELTTTNELVAPMVDTQQLGLLAIQNLVDNPAYLTSNPISEDIVTLFSAVASVVATQVSGSVGVITIPTAYISDVASLTAGNIINITSSANTGQARVVSIAQDNTSITVDLFSGNFTTGTGTTTITYGKNFITEEAATAGSVYSKYITRKIDFKNPCTSINVRLDVNKQAGTDITFYYKTLLTGESLDITSKEYTKLDYIVPITLANEFQEIEIQKDDLSPFVSIVFKIVFTSTNGKAPKCRNLRLIALA